MNIPNDKIQYKIQKYNNKYENTSNLKSKIIYSIKLYNYVTQLGGNELDDKINQIATKVDKINLDLDKANLIYSVVKQFDDSLSKIIKIKPYNKESSELITYYQDISNSIENFNLDSLLLKTNCSAYGVVVPICLHS